MKLTDDMHRARFVVLRTCMFGILASFCCSAVVAPAQEYIRIEAEITRTVPGLRGTNEIRSVFPVTCIVGTNEWFVECDYPKSVREASYYDGTNVYSRLQFVRDSRMKSFEAQRKAATNALPFCTAEPTEETATITITPSPGGHPTRDFSINIPWLAFCSGAYLKREGRVIAFPLDLITMAPDSFGYPDTTETFKDALGLPRSVELFTSKTQLVSSLSDERLYQRKRVQRFKDALAHSQSPPDGKVRFRYVATASTNFNGWTIPAQFTFESYRFATDGSASASVGGAGRLLAVTSAAKPRNVFLAFTNQTVYDARFRHETKNLDAIRYLWTNTDIPSMDDPRLQVVYANTLKLADADLAPARSWVRPVFRTLLVLSPILFVGLYYMMSRRP